MFYKKKNNLNKSKNIKMFLQKIIFTNKKKKNYLMKKIIHIIVFFDTALLKTS